MEKTGDISFETPQTEQEPRQKKASASVLTEKKAAELADNAANRVADAVAEAAKKHK